MSWFTNKRVFVFIDISFIDHDHMIRSEVQSRRCATTSTAKGLCPLRQIDGVAAAGAEYKRIVMAVVLTYIITFTCSASMVQPCQKNKMHI
jgi:hypothetical protein